MKNYIFFLIITLFFLTGMEISAQNTQTNDFRIGITYPIKVINTDGPVNSIIPNTDSHFNVQMVYPYKGYSDYTNPLCQGYPTSVLNQLNADGFNTVFSFIPGGSTYSENRIDSLMKLFVNYNSAIVNKFPITNTRSMKFYSFCNEWFVPQTCEHNDNGCNIYNNDITLCPWFSDTCLLCPHPQNDSDYQNPAADLKARTNYDYLFSHVFNKPEYQNVIWGHTIGGEQNALHAINPGPEVNNFYNNGNQANWYEREIPPQFVSDAMAHFRTITPANQKLSLSIVDHNGSYHDGFDDAEYNDVRGLYNNYPIDHNPQEYVYLENKPDVLNDESYFPFWLSYWKGFRYSNLYNNCSSVYSYDCAGNQHFWGENNSNIHYLGKYKNVDYLKSKCNIVHVGIGADYNTDTTLSDFNSRYIDNFTNAYNNANWLWFQAYTSIIHGVSGVWFYTFGIYNTDFPDSDWYRFTYQNVGGDWNDTTTEPNHNRFTLQYFAKDYQNYLRYLSTELAYLAQNNLLSTDSTSILYSKTDSADSNHILPSASSYISQVPSDQLPIDFSNGYNYGYYYNVPPDLKAHWICAENYGLRYTIRTNGTDIIMIISNPLNASLFNVPLDFSRITNSIISNSNGVTELFETNQIPVNDIYYKVNRNSGTDLISNSVNSNNQTYIPFYGCRHLNLDFGPMDVHVLKFTTLQTTNNNAFIYPNPNDGKFAVTIPQEFLQKNLILNIYNVSGQFIEKFTPALNDSKMEVQLETQAKGIYILQLNNGCKSYSGKVLKDK